MAAGLTLSIDNFTATITQFDKNGYERIPEEAGELEYSVTGAAIDDGPAYEHKLVWTIQGFADSATARQINLIWQRAERKRRTNQSYAVRLADAIEPFDEDVAAVSRTRAIVAGTQVTSIVGGGISYFAQFDVRIFQPKIVPSGNGLLSHNVSFVLRELDKVPS